MLNPCAHTLHRNKKNAIVSCEGIKRLVHMQGSEGQALTL